LVNNSGKTVRVSAGRSSAINDTGEASSPENESEAHLYPPSLSAGLGGINAFSTPAVQPPPKGRITAEVHF
jgi:hypothetical protein